jgi:hypothetical protein
LGKTSNVINLRWSIIAAMAAFAVSLVLGISVRGQILIILIRAFGFGVIFFSLAALIWRLINKYIPELLHLSSSEDPSLLTDLEPGKRVNITVEDGEDMIPPNVALPPEEKADDGVGNIAEVMSRGPSSVEDTGISPDSPGISLDSPAISLGSPGISLDSPVISPDSPAISAFAQTPAQGMDQNPQSGYTQNRNDPSGASPPPIQDRAGRFSGLGDVSGGIESLPDLDALAGSFLSPSAGGEDSVSAGQGLSPRPAGGARSKKGREVGEDFNPKEVASAIQTIIKRD